MQHLNLTYTELPQNYSGSSTIEFYLADKAGKKNLVALLRYKNISGKIRIDVFCTINWISNWDVDTFWMRDFIERMWKFDFWKKRYPWLWTECLELFISKLHESGYRSLELRSTPSAIWFYRKTAFKLLESWTITSWEQGNGWEIIKKMPYLVIKWVYQLYLDYLFKSLSNPDEFTFHFKK